jgi:alginate O-acetyltransferase complex protein AlgI
VTFTSPAFFLFLPLVFLAFRLAPARARWLVLLLASYVFYASFESLQLLATLAAITLISYAGGSQVARARNSGSPGSVLTISVLLCLTVLFVTKYLPHLPIAGHVPFLATIVSIGVSYYTFQAISYMIDIYLELQGPETHFGYFALYLAFFPKLLQGPIERGHDLLPQIQSPYRFDSDEIRSGLLLFAEGLFLKVVIAERLARYVNSVYDNVHSHSGLTLVLATYCYAVQIYCDFAGYTNMARGTARFFHLNVSENFNHPYAATSVTDFWRRWHISFSRWILDYIFKPLQLKWRTWGTWGVTSALLVTFLASGVWHGASWGFVIWGLLHGLYLAGGVLYRPYQKRLHAALGVARQKWYRTFQIFITFNLVSFAWIFFRANNVRDALYIVTHLANPSGWFPHKGLANFFSAQVLLGDHIRSAISLLLVLTVLLSGTHEWLRGLEQKPAVIKWPVYLALCYVIVMFGVWGNGARFVYFAF